MIDSYLQTHPYTICLDIGCGTLLYGEMQLSSGAITIGLDVNRTVLHRQRASATLRQWHGAPIAECHRRYHDLPRRAASYFTHSDGTARYLPCATARWTTTDLGWHADQR